MFTTEKAPGEIHEQPYRELLPEAPMKISAAIRIGAGDYFDYKTGGYCCLGVLDCVDQGMPTEEFLPRWGR
jgi:hypothetical protein